MSVAKDLCSIDHHKFNLVRPFVGAYNQFGTNRFSRTYSHFQAVTLVVTQHVIEKSRLPQRPFLARSEGD